MNITVGHQLRWQVVERTSTSALRISVTKVRGANVIDVNTSSEITIGATGAT